MTTEHVDRWIPDYAKHGYSLDEARAIAQSCEDMQRDGDEREWTEILAEVVTEYDASRAAPTAVFTAETGGLERMRIMGMETAFTARMEGVEHKFTAASLEAACEVTREWIREGDYGDVERTIWIDARLSWVDADGDEHDERVTATIDPKEPKCTAGAHEWCSPLALVGGIEDNPGVRGHGGGVIITECCRHCGCKKESDTGAQRSDTGERGLESVAYEARHWSAAELAEVWPPENEES